MFPFRLPDFRWFPFFRDRRQSPLENVYPQYPAPIPDQWHRSQSQSEQYPAYFNSSGYFDPGPWHGYTSYPSQENRRAYPSQLQGQYQPQQHQQVRNRHPPQNHPQPQLQTSQAAQPYFYPSDGGNSDPSHYYPRHRHHPQDRPKDNPGANIPFNHSQTYLTPQSIQQNTQQARTPFWNVSCVPSSHYQTQTPNTTATLNDHRRFSHSLLRSNTRVQATSTSRTVPKPASSNAPHIRSRMLKLPLVHPLVCGHRHSMIPDQIPETEVGKPERSVWDSRHFSLPQGSQAPMMIDALQVRSLSLDWDITLPPSFAKEIGRDGQVFTPPRHFRLPLIRAMFKSEVCIKTRQDNPLTKCFHRWGCIVVEPRDPNGIPPTMEEFLYDIWGYFHTSLTEEDCLLFTRNDLARLYQIARNRAENDMREGEQWPTRRDVLWGYTRFAGLEVCPRFADTGDLFLYLEPL